MTGQSIKKRPTIEDVARLAGVGVGTVSRYVTGNGSVKTSTRERIRVAVETLNYRPNVHAMGLRGAAPKTAGIVVPDISNPLFAQILKQLEARLRSADYSMVLASSSADPAQEAGIVSTLLTQPLEALFLIPVVEDNPALEAALNRARMPTVIIDRYFRLGVPGCAHIQTDHATGMRAAVRYLAETGHRHPLLLYVDGSRPGHERHLAFVTETSRYRTQGMVAEAIAGSQYTAFGHDVIASRMAEPIKPDAIIVGHNQMLPHVLLALRRCGLRVGADVSLIMCDRTDLSDFHSPPIASISRDLARIGETAFELFRQLAAHPESSPLHAIDTSFEVSDSVVAYRPAR